MMRQTSKAEAIRENPICWQHTQNLGLVSLLAREYEWRITVLTTHNYMAVCKEHSMKVKP